MNAIQKRGIVAVALLVGLSVVVVGCSQGSSQGSSQRSGQDGSEASAQLSNADLLKKAVADMKALNSFHFDFKGDAPDLFANVGPTWTMTGDIQMMDDKGSKVNITNGGGAVASGSGADVIFTKGSWTESYDGGKTWQTPTSDTIPGYIMAMFGRWWQDSRSAGKDQTAGEKLINIVTFKDGDPRLEQVDGVLTRHIVADFTDATRNVDDMMLLYEKKNAKTVSMWVSTDISPTIRQMRIDGSNILPNNYVGTANAVAFSPDSKTLAVAYGDDKDWTIRLWDLTNPAGPPRKLHGDRGRFWSVAFSPDGKTLAASTFGGEPSDEVVLWDIAKPDAMPTPVVLPVAGGPRSVAFRPDGQMLAAASTDGVYIWQFPFAGVKPTILGHAEGAEFSSVVFSSDNHTLAAGNLTGVNIYDVRHPDATPTVLPFGQVIGATTNLAFSSNGYLLASTGNERNTAKIWDLRQSVPSSTILPGYSGQSVSFSPDGRFLATCDGSPKLSIWDLKLLTSSNISPAAALVLDGGQTLFLSVAFSPEGKKLAATGSDSGAYLWDTADLYNAATSGSPGVATTPHILKEDEQPTDTPYSLTWKWSRFNEDFGDVKAPPTEGVK